MSGTKALPKVFAQPLAVWERDGLAAALGKAGLATEDVGAEGLLFWRFLTADDVPAGFGGLEMHARDALMRSIVILPPLRRQHVGTAIVRSLEMEARVLGVHAIWLVTDSAALFFERLGYAAVAAHDVPEAVRASAQFRQLSGPAAIAMLKRLR
jgi:N-acetylglutamate synthase-like GNAT family acetyltransferase